MIYHLFQVRRHSLQLSINVFSQLVPTRCHVAILNNMYTTDTVIDAVVIHVVNCEYALAITQTQFPIATNYYYYYKSKDLSGTITS